jgi:hypothetical protein
MQDADDATRARHSLLRWIYLRGLGVIYLIAFASLIPQVEGLIGSQGILPVAGFVEAVKSNMPWERGFMLVPSIFWLGASDNVLMAATISGCIASLFVIAGFAAAPALIVCWILYLSFVNGGQDFLSFQWDALLLEAGFLAMFMAPWTVLDKWKGQRAGLAQALVAAPTRTIIFMWMTRWLLFRLMLLSGLVKIGSHDPSWLNATALNYHYETQPLPTPLAWFMHQLPPSFDSFCTICMFVVELIVPFFMLGGRRARIFAAVATISLQVMILLTGNYTFFNLLTILLCVSLFDNSSLPRFEKGTKKSYPWLSAPIAIAIFVISIVEIADEFTAGNAVSPTANDIVAFTQPFRLVNTYGLFAVMTTTRDEITMEGSDDGENWKAYVFPFKPGPLDRAPPIVAPYQPRLDWQMWFASLGSVRRDPWVVTFGQRLLEGSKPVLSLLATNPFPDRPPRFVRATVATYHFTDFAERDKTHNWWKADSPSLYMPPIEKQIVE